MMETVKGHGLANTVAWTQLAQAMRADGMSVGDTCPPHIASFIRDVVSATLTFDTERGVVVALDALAAKWETGVILAKWKPGLDVAAKDLRDLAAALRAQPAGGGAVRDREADRARFPDADFNRWLDEGISDCGHIVWHQIASIECAWAAWDSRPYYAKGRHPLADAPDDELFPTPPESGGRANVDEEAAARAFAARVGEDWEQMSETARNTVRRMAGEKT